jgi:nucleotide-binding universal stress UspA family protein
MPRAWQDRKREADMKQILLPFGSDSASDAPIAAAATLAARHGGQVTAMFYPRLPDPVIVDPMSGGVVSYDGLDEEIETQKASAAERIQERAAKCEPSLSGDHLSVDMSGLSNWRQVGEVCRVHDIALVACSPDNPHWQTLFEMALFEGGRPVMLVPEGWNKPYGDTIGIAWNHATETARVVAMGMPIIAKAKKVVVIGVDGWVHAGPDTAALQKYLEGHGIETELRTGASGGNPGDRALEVAASADVDLMIKGAYTQSRLTQMIFGGATRAILDRAQIPVVFAN